ncbi:hypothetical protein [Streptomyces rimosus]|uniref:hypothetical protein n=1 Tax=Streptomyces rimosus TaxID=1927 RepID=UPI00067CC06D|nr:hypothetical protein [Streptomyces rimosus]
MTVERDHPVASQRYGTSYGARSLTFRHPTVADTDEVHTLARRSAAPVTRAACRICCRDFARTSMVAGRAGAVVGFLGGYRRPADPRTYVAWHLVTLQEEADVALALMAAMAGSVRRDGAEVFEAPAGPDAPAHAALVRELARTYHAVPDTSTPARPSSVSPGGDPTVLYRFALTGGPPDPRPPEPPTCRSHNSRC